MNIFNALFHAILFNFYYNLTPTGRYRFHVIVGFFASLILLAIHVEFIEMMNNNTIRQTEMASHVDMGELNMSRVCWSEAGKNVHGSIDETTAYVRNCMNTAGYPNYF